MICGINSPLPLKQPVHYVRSLPLQGTRRCDRSLNSSRYVFKASAAAQKWDHLWTHTFHLEGANQITKWYILLFHIFFLRCRRAIGCFLKEGYILNKLSYWLLGMIETHGFHYKSREAPTYQNPHLGTWRCAALRIPLPQSLPEASISGPCVMSNGRLKFL